MNARLACAASESDADLLYLTQFPAPDPFPWLQIRGRSILLLSDLEIDRAKASARANECLSLSALEKRHAPRAKHGKLAKIIAAVLQQHRVRAVEVPRNFPHGLAADLARLGIRATPCRGPFVPRRAFKSPGEIQFLLQAQRAAETGMARARDILRAAKPARDHTLRWRGRVLTSETLQAEINMTLAGAGAHAAHTIVAGGSQACDPHERGHGPLRAGEAILIDIFPRMIRSGYWGDITRTFVKGPASDALHRLYNAVLRGQKMALASLRPGCDGPRLQSEIRAFFAREGFPTEIRDGRRTGFFHGLGHGVGLEIHEPPRFADGRLRAGHVVTVEPGLYFPGLGAARVEDLVAIVPGGHKNLTTFPKTLEL